MKPGERIILALDVPDYNEAVDMVTTFKEHIDIFKVGSELFTSAGPQIIETLHSMGKRVFLDLKFHDIPTTVTRSSLVVAKLGVFMFNVHTMGGYEMMQVTSQAISDFALHNNSVRPKLIGVTILTSIDQTALKNDLGIELRMSAQVKHLANLAERAGLDGVVASAEDADMIRTHTGKDFLIVTPGIRPSWVQTDDQKRTLTPKKALQMGADYLVIGRAITSQPSPLEALKRVESEIADA
jgi:orotidine-5'-phosphate decarboxylase